MKLARKFSSSCSNSFRLLVDKMYLVLFCSGVKRRGSHLAKTLKDLRSKNRRLVEESMILHYHLKNKVKIVLGIIFHTLLFTLEFIDPACFIWRNSLYLREFLIKSCLANESILCWGDTHSFFIIIFFL